VGIGDLGNPSDTTGYGAVNYEYSMLERPVTVAEYVTFLNEVDPTGAGGFEGDLDQYGLVGYSGGQWQTLAYTGCNSVSQSFSASDTGKMLMSLVSLNQAARYANWVATGDINQGAYRFSSSTNGNASISSIDANYPGPRLPTENEYYKAAYWDTAAQQYNLYGTTSVDGSGNPLTGTLSSTGLIASTLHPYPFSYGADARGNCMVYVQSGQGGRSAYGLSNLVGGFHDMMHPNDLSTSSIVLRPDNQFSSSPPSGDGSPFPHEHQRSTWRWAGVDPSTAYSSPSFRLVAIPSACGPEPATPVDYGDAPDTAVGVAVGNYRTLSNDNGPKHTIVNTLYLGTAAPDNDADGYNSAGVGDDTSGTNDENSISAFPAIATTDTTYSLSNIPVYNITGTSATLYAWIDFNRNGRFDGNEAATVTVPHNATTVNLNWSGLTGGVAGASYARFRLTTQTLTNSNSSNLTLEDTRSYGVATNGEVEDYALTITAAPVQPPLTCDSSLYQISADGSTGGNSYLRKIIFSGGSATFSDIGAGAGSNVNGGYGYNQVDNYIYGLSYDDVNNGGPFHMYRIGSDGSFVNLGQVTGLPSGTFEVIIGDVLPDGKMLIRSKNTDSTYYVIDLVSNPLAVSNTVTFTGLTLRNADWAYNPQDNSMYSIDQADDRLVKVDLTTNVASFIGSATLTGQYGAHWFDQLGNYYVYENLTGDFFQVDLQTGAATKISSGVPTSDNDGASCRGAPPVPMDFGDAPANYGHPNHVINGLKLGATVDSDTTDLSGTTALGDDTDGTDDEDAISSLPALTAGATSYSLSTIPVTNTTGSTATLYGWVDFNRNNRFDGNEAATATVANGATSVSLNWSGLTGVTAGASYVRLRLTTQALTNTNSGDLTLLDTRSGGAASDGEVEDYALSIAAAPVFVPATSCPSGMVTSTTNMLNNGSFAVAPDNTYIYPAGDDGTDNVTPGFFYANASFYSQARYRGFDVYPSETTPASNGFSIIQDTAPAYPQIAFPGDPAHNTPATPYWFYSNGNALGIGDDNGGPAQEYLLWEEDANNLVVGKTYSFVAYISNVLETNGAVEPIVRLRVDGTGGMPDGTVVFGPYHIPEAATANSQPLNGWQRVEYTFTASSSSMKFKFTSAAKSGFGDDFGMTALGVNECVPTHDYGDAPVSGTAPDGVNTNAYGEASHALVTGTYMGTGDPDTEDTNQPTTNADGDDADGTDDEDGVTLPTLTQGQTATITATVAGAGGYLQGWIDWNGDGTFGAGEQIATNIQDNLGVDTNNAAGTMAFTVNVPANAITAQTFARFRWSTTAGLDATTAASDGEVEDYALTILAIVQEDFGDAPASYGDAIHRFALTPEVYLGTKPPDKETQSQNAANGGVDGLGDENNGDEEDGVANFPALGTGNKDYSLNVTVNNSSGSTARLVGWIDFNGNGIFDSTEAASIDVANGASNKIVALTWKTLPADIQPGASFVRLRLTTDSSVATGTASSSLPTGTANNGEVEDYAFTINDGGYDISGTVYNDANVNASNDTEKGIKNITMVLYDSANGTCRSTKTAADGRYHFSGVQPAAANNYVLYEAAAENHTAPSACPPAETDPNGYVSSTANNQTVTVTTANVSGVDFGDVKVPTFTLDNSQVILPNTTVAYPHIFRSAADGTVTFTLAESADPSSLEWGTGLYLDNNCDAALDAGDTAITGSIGVSAGDKLCILSKVLAPANATAGAKHTLDVSSSFVYGDGTIITTAAQQTRTDITTTSSGTSTDPVGGEGKLSLVKSVWNATRGTTVGDNDGSVALPGETLRYTIRYENIGNGELDELVVHDNVPAFTQMGGSGQQCGNTPPELSACTPAELGGALDWTFIGKLKSGSSGDVYYEVVVE
jgi:uncharacterized repeat protein (TIGR01451 family)